MAANASDKDYVEVRSIYKGLTYPWGIAALPSGDFLVSEKTGKVLRISNNAEQATLLLNLSNALTLFDVELHPDFSRTRRIYFTYATEERGEVGLEVASGFFEGDAIHSVAPIFSVEPKVRSALNMGGRLAFLPDGTLLVTIGDQGYAGNAQDVAVHQGKLVRLADDGSIPDDNPLLQSRAALPGIFGLGFRNPQGIAVDQRRGTVWVVDHGPIGGDELDLVLPGGNYGWGKLPSETTTYTPFKEPVANWTPAIAPSSLLIYTGDLFPSWRGNLFITSLRGQHLRRIVVADSRVESEERLLGDFGERLRDLAEGKDGALYVLTDSPRGEILRIGPSLDQKH